MRRSDPLIISVIIASAILTILGITRCDDKPKPGDIVAIDTVIRYEWDTVVIERQPIYIVGNADTVIFHDTTVVYQTPAFTSTLDTIVERDTFTLGYKYPQQQFSLALRMAADSVVYQQQTVYITKEVMVPPPFWQQVGTHGAALISGFAIGRFTQ